MLACPRCGWLLHGAELTRLATDAEAAETRADHETARRLWGEVLDRLPAGSRQHQVVSARLQGAMATAGASGAASPPSTPSRKGRWIAGAGAASVLLWKLKFLPLLLFGKLKLLLVGLTKVGTLFSMVASLGVYWAAFGWRFAAGIIGSIYVHEMGHVAALRRRGIAASAPMFVPGLGAFVRLKQSLPDPVTDADVGLAGPRWGTAAALVAQLAGMVWSLPALSAIAHVGAWLNLFNLLPVWQLDGGRAFAALSKAQRLGAGVSVLGVFVVGGDALLLLLAGAGVWRAWTPSPPEGSRRVLFEYLLLVAILALLIRR
jgi:Zn-dependent protease